MILEIDIGNTRIKWRQKRMNGDGVIGEGVFANEGDFILASSQYAKPNIFRLSNVREQELTERLVSWGREIWNLDPLIAEVSRKCGGVNINYQDVSRLGVDRWLAMLAGYKIATSACVIVDCGTAFTLDSITTKGNHLGGFILPGLGLMRQSLSENTRVRISPKDKHQSIALGNSTGEAVLNGSLAALLALIEKEVAKIKVMEGSCRLILTGGDSHLLKGLINAIDAELVPSLVLDGLAIACPGDEEFSK